MAHGGGRFEMSAEARPLGITLLAVLHILKAIFLFLGGIALIALGAFVRRGFFGIPRFLNGAVILVGGVILAVGLLYLGLAWGLWTGKGWAWAVSLLVTLFGLIVSLVSLAIGGLGAIVVLILDSAIVYYLFRPNVRAFFSGQKTSPQPVIQSASQPVTATSFCSNCGAPTQGNEKFCSHCGKPIS